MLDAIKRIKAGMILTSIVYTLLGIVLLIWPEMAIDIFCKVLAAGLAIIGVMNIISYFVNRDLHPFGAILGTIIVLVGVWIFARPQSIVSLVPIVIGVMLCGHGIENIKLAFEAKGNGYQRWWSMLLIAVISLIFGLLCISNAFGMVTLALQVIALALIYDGLTDLWVANRMIQVAKEKKRAEEALEVEYREVEFDTQEKE